MTPVVNGLERYHRAYEFAEGRGFAWEIADIW
jgi:hypothetical protein